MKLLRTILAATAVAATAALPAFAQTATLDPIDGTEVPWGSPLRVLAQATIAYSCALPLRAVRVTLRTSSTVVGTGDTYPSCRDDILTTRMTFYGPGDLPFGSFALIADFGAPYNLSTRALIVRLNPQYSFVLPNGQGVVRSGIGHSRNTSMTTCAVKSMLLQQRADLGISPPPPNMRYPYEHLLVSVAGCQTENDFMVPEPTGISVRIEFPDPIQPGSELWIHETSRDGSAAPWKRIAAIFDGRQAYFELVGGGTTASFDRNINATVALAVPQRSFADAPLQDLWWHGPDEGGWGLNIAKNGYRIFATLFTYDDNGKAQWVVMPSGTWDPVHGVYYGDLYIPTGSPYSNYDADIFGMQSPVGTGSLSFITDDEGNFDYTLNGVAGGTRIGRYKFAPRGAELPRYAGMWWGGPKQNGWGVSIQQQGQTLFATWYTYGADRKVTWFYMPGGSFITPTTYTGTLYRATGARWAGVPFNPASVHVIAVGIMKLEFSGPNAATMTTTVDGVTQTQPIARFDF